MNNLTITSASISVSVAAVGDPAQRKLTKAAQDFEAILLANWLEKMQSSVGLPGGEEADAAHDNLQSMAVQMAATGIAKAGGLGIAKMLLKQVHTPSITNVTTEIVKTAGADADATLGGKNKALGH